MMSQAHSLLSPLPPPFCRTPFILADSVAEVSLGLKLWAAHLPPLEPPRGFHVQFTVVHNESEHWSTGEP